jgi:hypothetical protein
MIAKVVRQVSLGQSEDLSISDWASYSHAELLAIGYQLKQQYLYTFNLSDRVDKTKVTIATFQKEE